MATQHATTQATTQDTTRSGWTVLIESDGRNRRRRSRRLGLEEMVDHAIRHAEADRRDAVVADHGGGVASAYKYPAVTDAIMAVALYQERVVIVRAEQIRANKVTKSGVAARTWGDEARPLFDSRYGTNRTRAARTLITDRARKFARDWFAQDDRAVTGYLDALTTARVERERAETYRAQADELRTRLARANGLDQSSSTAGLLETH